MYTIAIAEDEEGLREAVAEYLGGFDYRVLQAPDGPAFRSLCERETVDLAILDIRMPREDGLSLARWFRSRSKGGIIFATAADQPVDRVVGLELGADDYLIKPFELRELLARVRCVLRRIGDQPAPISPAASAPEPRVIVFGDFRLDLRGRRLLDGAGRPVPLTVGEFDLLQVLAERPRRVQSRDSIAELLGVSGVEAGRGIDIRMTRLRKKIEAEAGTPRFLRTLRGQGYVFTPDGRP